MSASSTLSACAARKTRSMRPAFDWQHQVCKRFGYSGRLPRVPNDAECSAQVEVAQEQARLF
jgi:hypothetical protein